MINFLRFSNRRRDQLESEADRRRATEALKRSGMPEDKLEAMLADEHLSGRVRAHVLAALRERSEPRGVQFPSPARAAATFGLLTLLLVGLAWAGPRVRIPRLTGDKGPVEPAAVGATCQLGGAGCRVSEDQALRTLVQLESLESQR